MIDPPAPPGFADYAAIIITGISIPLGIWKAIEIMVWLIQNVDISIGAG